jgi:alpha-L-rhamnosidase
MVPQEVDPIMSTAPHDLRCEYFTNPLGLDVTRPRLFWRLQDARRGAAQTAYQIRIASAPQHLAGDTADIWDSGRVASAATTHIEAGGPPPTSGERRYWQVRVWDDAGEASPWSETQWWEMGLLRRQDWKASWIGHPAPATDEVLFPAPCLRREWTLNQPATRARLYVTARGLYDVSINGQPVTNDAMRPGWTDYSKRQPYQTYDVTALLREGANAIGAMLGTGWYCGNLAWKKQVYGKRPRLLLQLDLTLADGSRRRVCSDDAWRATDTGPIRQSDMLIGEQVDLRCALTGWDAPGFSDSDWAAVAVEPRDDIPLVAHVGPPVRTIEELRPVTTSTLPSGATIVDLGQNMVGHMRLRVPAGLPAGTTLVLRHAEILNPDGTLYTTNLRSATSTDQLTLDGQACTWEPRFTFHGFRYVELSGSPVPPTADWFTGIVRHSVIPTTGSFACSNPLLNQLQHNIQWGQRGNFLEVPTDCPQRNERLGWMGDAQVFVRTACFNADVAAFFTKWMVDVVDAQRADGNFTDVAPDILTNIDLAPDMLTDNLNPSPAWTDAGVIVPWTVYRCYGDRRLLATHYPALKRYLTLLERRSTGLIGPDAGYGDWLQVDTFTPLDLISTAYFAHSADLMARIAGVLGRAADARRYAALFRRVTRAFQNRFMSPDGRLAGDTQAAYVLALYFNLVPANRRDAVVRNLVTQVQSGRSAVWPYPARNNHLSTGFVAVNKICFALAEGGDLPLAYRLLLNEDYPSWLFPVKQGATTIWERWDGWTPEKGFQDPGMNSFNHYAYGAIGEWLYQVVAGLDLADDGDGGTHWRIAPRPLHPDDAPAGLTPITHAEAAHDSLHGRVRSAWVLDGDRLTLDLTVPPNTRATVVLPTSDASTATEGDTALAQAPDVRDLRTTADTTTVSVAAGTYRFTCRLARARSAMKP